VLPSIEFTQIGFRQPAYLWLLVAPGLMLALWLWRLAERRAGARRLGHQRLVPIPERIAIAGDLPFWLCVITAIALLIVALARPHGPARAVRHGGIDLVLLQDASASMRVKDVEGDRWQRSMRFIRAIGDALSWKSDRIAMAIFARIAAPQIRLTRDPNTFFFFLDHLDDEPPFRIEEDSTWDTNLELGIHWGLRVVERDEEVHGKSPNAKIFVVVSDGELWSGEVEKSIARARERAVAIFVVGVGTLGGGRLPVVIGADGQEIRDDETPLVSRLDRLSLQQIARSGGGAYFELDREIDRHIANSIVDAGKRLAPTLGVTEQAEDLYWRFLVMAMGALAVGLPFVRERTDLWIHAVGIAAILIGVSTILG
jgi:Ca-activated chloride channel family protein